MARGLYPTQVRLDRQHLADLDLIQHHHGLPNSSATIRFLIQSEAKRIRREKGEENPKNRENTA